ncbi:MAG: hypothetical protein H7641_09280 [Candidatus Heimdallarchaeota archaeon]|nr:hypothetical protein [Candidatus Heimdallarchaeota archaeon]MCK4877758.1 hypothetical protein [Candidatus Heimdallarchaeota archaeon]
MKKLVKFSIFILVLSTLLITPTRAQDDVSYYYSEKFVKNSVFTWNVNQSINYYESLPKNANFTVKLKDALYPGPMTPSDLNSIYIAIDVDGEKYSGEGFPLFWHIRKINGTVETTIKEEFENSPEVFNVSTISSTLFRTEFTIFHENYTLTIEMDIDSADGLTKRYFEYFTDNVDLESVIELVFTNYTVEASFQFLWVVLGFFLVTSTLVVNRRRKK